MVAVGRAEPPPPPPSCQLTPPPPPPANPLPSQLPPHPPRKFWQIAGGGGVASAPVVVAPPPPPPGSSQNAASKRPVALDVTADAHPFLIKIFSPKPTSRGPNALKTRLDVPNPKNKVGPGLPEPQPMPIDGEVCRGMERLDASCRHCRTSGVMLQRVLSGPPRRRPQRQDCGHGLKSC